LTFNGHGAKIMLSVQVVPISFPAQLRDCGLNAIVFTGDDGPVREMVMPIVDGETYAGRAPFGSGAGVGIVMLIRAVPVSLFPAFAAPSGAAGGNGKLVAPAQPASTSAAAKRQKRRMER
jgi:hypothetical protein